MVTFRIVSLLEKSKAFSDRLFDAMPGAILVLDAKLRVLRSNNEATKMFMSKVESVTGRSFGDIFDPVDYEVIKSNIAKLLQGYHETFEVDLPVRGVEGKREFHWQFRRFIVGSKADHMVINVVGRDITEMKQVLQKKMELEKDLHMAGRTQQLLLPKKDSVEEKNWRLAACYEPAVKAGGDWWKYEVRPDGSVVIFLGDISGQGVGSGMVTSMILGCYKTLVKFNPNVDVEVFIAEFDQQLNKLGDGKYSMNLYVLDLHPMKGYFEWYCAAASGSFLISNHGSVAELSASGKPLGLGPLAFKRGRQNLNSGDRVFCATNGVFKSSENSDLPEKTSIVDILTQRGLSAVQLREQIKTKLSNLRKTRPSQEDTSFVIFESLV